MTMRSIRVFGLTLLLLPACTAVLGMDRAELDESLATGGTGASGGTGGAVGGAGGSGGSQSTLSECTTTSSACMNCLNGCGTFRDECLHDGACRRALDHYGVCLKGGCTDDGHCLNRLSEEISTPAALRLIDCLRDECTANDGPCVGNTVMSKCERYCACMQQNCNAQFANWSGTAQCLQACEALPAFDRDCRGDHCEFGAEDQIHCHHAIGEAGLNKCAQAPKMPTLCLDKSDVKGPCIADADCCAGLTCINQECG